MSEIKCKGCGKQPSEIPSVSYFAECENMTPDEFIKKLEGTYNPKTNLFYCDECYIRLGTPLGKA